MAGRWRSAARCDVVLSAASTLVMHDWHHLVCCGNHRGGVCNPWRHLPFGSENATDPGKAAAKIAIRQLEVIDRRAAVMRRGGLTRDEGASVRRAVRCQTRRRGEVSIPRSTPISAGQSRPQQLPGVRGRLTGLITGVALVAATPPNAWARPLRASLGYSKRQERAIWLHP
jgi:hypothetical protein